MRLSIKIDRHQPSDSSTPGREHRVHEKHLLQLDDRKANYNAEIDSENAEKNP